MKIKPLLGAIFFALVSSHALAVTQEQSNAFIGELQQSSNFTALMQQQSADDVLELVNIALSQSDLSAQDIVQSAMEAFPSLASEIVQVAIDNGLESEVITTAAILAGLDPTIIGQATAAGNVVSPLAAPATQAIAGSGGTGTNPPENEVTPDLSVSPSS